MPAHSPRGNDGAEGLQDVSSSQALLGVEDQQFPDETHGVLRNPAIPDAGEGEGGEGSGGSGGCCVWAPGLPASLCCSPHQA